MTSHQGIQSNNIFHHRCETISYYLFYHIILSDNYKLLIISGNPTDEELNIAWISVTQEYTSLLQNEQAVNIFNLWKKMVQMECNLLLLDSGLRYLKYEYDIDIANEISNLGYPLIENNENREEYLKQVYVVENETKTLIVLLNQCNNEYKILTKSSLKSKRTEIDYEKEVRILSKFMGYRINSKEISVLEFVSIANLYQAQNKVK